MTEDTGNIIHIPSAEYERQKAGYDRPSRIHLVPFDEIKLGKQRRYLVKGLIPRVGMTVVWGPPKCGKSFWAFDVAMHVCLGWQYRERRVQQGPVVYCAFEGQTGIESRVEAFRQEKMAETATDVPFYLEPVTLDLVGEHKGLIEVIKQQLGTDPPVMVVLDTLNRSLRGSESSDQDMTAYVRAADAIRDELECAVVIVHHCGIESGRPRGHTSLTGAADAQLKVSKDRADNIVVGVEFMKDGPCGEEVVSALETVEVGTDEDGETITSCIVREAENTQDTSTRSPRLSKNQQTMLSILHDGQPLTTEEWNERARAVGIGVKRRPDLYDVRKQLQDKQLIYQGGNGWSVRTEITE